MEYNDIHISLAPSSPRTYLTFPQAMAAIIDGLRITKREWQDEQFWAQLNSQHGLLMLRKPDALYYAWTISEGDLMSDDWYVLR